MGKVFGSYRRKELLELRLFQSCSILRRCVHLRQRMLLNGPRFHSMEVRIAVYDVCMAIILTRRLSGGADTVRFPSLTTGLSSSEHLYSFLLKTASSLSTFFLAMCTHPRVQLAGQVELDSVIGSERLPTISDRAQLPYINAIVKEVLRWGPVAPLGES